MDIAMIESIPTYRQQLLLRNAVLSRARAAGMPVSELFLFLNTDSETVARIMSMRATRDDIEDCCMLCFAAGIPEANPAYLFKVSPDDVFAWLDDNYDVVVKKSKFFAEAILRHNADGPRTYWWYRVGIVGPILTLLYPLRNGSAMTNVDVMLFWVLIAIAVLFIWLTVRVRLYENQQNAYVGDMEKWAANQNAPSALPAEAQAVPTE